MPPVGMACDVTTPVFQSKHWHLGKSSEAEVTGLYLAEWLQFILLEFFLLEFIWFELPNIVQSLRVALQFDHKKWLGSNLNQMKLHIVSDTTNLQMGCVMYVIDEQVRADSLDIKFLFFEQFNKIDCRVSIGNKLIKDKKLKIPDLCNEIKLFFERNTIRVKASLEFADNILKATNFPALLNRNDLFTKILINVCKFRSGHLGDQSIIIKIKKLGKIPIPTAVVGSFNICRLDGRLIFGIPLAPQMEKQKLCNITPFSICSMDMAEIFNVKLCRVVHEQWLIILQSSRIVIPDNEGGLVLFSKDLQGIRENNLATDIMIGRGSECESLTFSSSVFVKISLCLVNTPQNASDHHVFLVFEDEDEDQWGRKLKLAKSNDDNFESAHVFCRDIDSIHPLKNLRLIISAFQNNLLNSVTVLMCICMCFYAYVPFSKYARESSIDAVTNEIANDSNIIGNSSSIVESSKTNFLSEEYPCIDESGRVSTLVAQKRKLGVRRYVYCMKFYFRVNIGYSLSALDGFYIFFCFKFIPSRV